MGKLSPSSTDFAEAMGISDQKPADLWQWLLTRIEKSQMPFLTKIKELFKQDHEEGFERGKTDLFSSDSFKSLIHSYFCLLLCGPRYSEREDSEVTQEGKETLQKKEKR